MTSCSLRGIEATSSFMFYFGQEWKIALLSLAAKKKVLFKFGEMLYISFKSLNQEGSFHLKKLHTVLERH
jgi:hypothetical protein